MIPQGLRLSFSLFLILELIHRPGVAQVGGNARRCCTVKLQEPPQEKLPEFVQHGNYLKCPFNNVKFTLQNQAYCFQMGNSWVQKMIKCIDKGRDLSCIKPLNPDPNQEFSRGGPDKQPPASARPPTSTASRDVSTLKTTKPPEPDIPTTASRDVSTLKTTKPPEPDISTTAYRRPNAESPDSIQRGHDQDNEPSAKETEEKMREMKIAIITLVGIVLLATAIGTTLWCRRRREEDGCDLTFKNQHQGYTITASEDSEL